MQNFGGQSNSGESHPGEPVFEGGLDQAEQLRKYMQKMSQKTGAAAIDVVEQEKSRPETEAPEEQSGEQNGSRSDDEALNQYLVEQPLTIFDQRWLSEENPWPENGAEEMPPSAPGYELEKVPWSEGSVEVAEPGAEGVEPESELLDYEQELEQEDREEVARWLEDMQGTDEKFWKKMQDEQWSEHGVEIQKDLPDFSDLHGKAVVYLNQIAPGLNPAGLKTRASMMTKIAMRRLAEAAGDQLNPMHQEEWHKDHALGEFIMGVDGVRKPVLKKFYKETPPQIAQEVYEEMRKAYGAGTLIAKGKGDDLSDNEIVALHAMDKGKAGDTEKAGGVSFADLVNNLVPENAPLEVKASVCRTTYAEAEKRINNMSDNNPLKQRLIEMSNDIYKRLVKMEAAMYLATSREEDAKKAWGDRSTETKFREAIDFRSLGVSDEAYADMPTSVLNLNIEETEKKILPDLYDRAVEGEFLALSATDEAEKTTWTLYADRANELAIEYHTKLRRMKDEVRKRSEGETTVPAEEVD